jgi:hypothetical protein
MTKRADEKRLERLAVKKAVALSYRTLREEMFPPAPHIQM